MEEEGVVQTVAPLENPDELPETCHVCWDGASYDDNPILYCEGCDVAVHQLCYGVKRVPTGDWFCRACERDGKSTRKSAASKRCCLCSVEGGALKPAAGNRWAHLFCSNWLPETYIKDVKAMEPVGGIDDIDPDRFGLKCEVCGKRDEGACIQCDFGHCSVAYHPMCAFMSGEHCMEIRSENADAPCEYRSFCAKHSKSRINSKKREEVKEDEEEVEEAGALANGSDEEMEEDVEEAVAETPARRGRGRPPKSSADASPARDVPAATKTEPAPSSVAEDTPGKENKPAENLVDFADAEIRSLLRTEMALTETDAAATAKEARVDGGAAALDTWLAAADAEVGDEKHKNTTRAIRAWLRARSLATIKPEAKVEAEATVPEAKTEEAVAVDAAADAADDADADANPVPESAHEPPPHVEELFEHTVRALRAPPPEIPKEPESAKPEEEKKPSGPGPGRPPKCAVCVIHKKGICGTASAPAKCHRRKGGAAPPPPLEGVDAPPSMEEELAALASASDLLSLAPDDEVVGELLQAHGALARALWITRTLAAKALAAASAAAEDEEAEREEKLGWVEDTEKYEERWRGGRWREEYLRKRGLPSADARGANAEGGETIARGIGEGGEMVDPLVETGAMEDALCAVCGGGDSEAPNEILFCERCEVAVHQDCYGVAEVPEGDWLCWPCHVAEANEVERGLPPSRPPRWLREAGDGSLYDPRPSCCLCPVKRGALRAVVEPERLAPAPRAQPADAVAPMDADDDAKAEAKSIDAAATPPATPAATPAATAAANPAAALTPGSPAAARRAALVGFEPGRSGKAPPPERRDEDRREGVVRWAHVVCAQCVPGVEVSSVPGPGAAAPVIRGLERVPPSAFSSECQVCGLSEGAVVQCGYPGCAVTLHPMCARRAGWLMSDVARQEDKRRVFCGRHSIVERRRLENGEPTRAGGGRGRGRGRGRPPIHGGRGGRGGRGASRRRAPPSRDEMELLKRARFGLEKLRLLCERVLRREKQKRRETELQTELWTMQMAGLDDGAGADTPRSPPPSPGKRRVYFTAGMVAAANATLPPGFVYERE